MQNNTKNKHEILLGLTTTPASDWKRKCNEIKTLGVKKIALFPTFLAVKDRRKLYDLLEDSGIEEIPHVHLRGQDMEKWEMEMFETKYKTQLYNIHPLHAEVDNLVLAPYRHKIFIENNYKNFNEKLLEKYAGLCADFSHMEEARVYEASICSKMDDGILDRYRIGCCHVSAIKLSRMAILNKIFGVSRHTLKEMSEVDYVLKYKKYLPNYVSLELQNSFEQQLEIKAYLEKLLNI